MKMDKNRPRNCEKCRNSELYLLRMGAIISEYYIAKVHRYDFLPFKSSPPRIIPPPFGWCVL